MKTTLLIWFLTAMTLTFIVTVIAARILIPILKSKKMGQKILDIGPRWHKSKEGTPTMGGITFIIGMTVTFLTVGLIAVFRDGIENNYKFIITFIMALLNGLIGVFDDLTKFSKKQNEGLSAKQKMFFQLLVAGLYLFFMTLTNNITTAVYIPFIGYELELGWFYYVFALILVTGVINSVNLIDGIDGLTGTVTSVVGGYFLLTAFMIGSLESAVLSAMLIGGCLGFLVYNFYPAKLFMGDTGSLFLGGIVIGLAFMVDNPLIIVIAGLIYIFESLSVMIQVGYFKLTHGKRFFKMAPIHHHFEKCGWGELKIVAVFSLFTLIMCVIAYFGIRV